MRSSRKPVITVLAATALAVAAATAHADPGSAGVHYTADIVNNSIVATLGDGAVFTGDGSTVTVADATGRVLETLPLSYTFDGSRHAIAHDISDGGRTLRLTPDLNGLAGQPPLHYVATPLENQLAANDVINAANLGLSIGSLVGTVIGTALGIGVGFVLAGASCLVLSVGCVVAVLPIMSLVAGAGGILGLIVGGGGAIVPAVFNYLDTVKAPPGTSIYASQIPALAGTAPGEPIPATPAP